MSKLSLMAGATNLSIELAEGCQQGIQGIVNRCLHIFNINAIVHDGEF